VGKAFIDPALPEAIAIGKHIHQLGIQERVIMPGFVSDEDLVGLYAQAEALLYPSFAEGFGFPVLEAQASGCPVITSNTSSVVEIAGPAVLVDPTKTEDIRHGLDMILSLTSENRRILIQKGLDWSRQFTWEKVAHATAHVYAETFNNHTGI
jgi:glycosyltransferase involved in cell wall biosynthesis